MDWFNNLPWQWQVILTILLCISVSIISIYGRFFIIRDKLKIGIGGDKGDTKNSKSTTDSKNHSCGECYMIIRNQVIETERKIKSVESSRFDRQMNFLDQKFEELQADFTSTYSDLIHKNRAQNLAPGVETIQFRLYEGLLNDAFGLLKKEIRRALRENGYTTLPGGDYINYVRNETRTILNMLYNHVRKLYPPIESNMVVPINEVLNDIESSYSNLEQMVMAFFDNAKEINIQVDNEIRRLDKECDAICSQFVGVPVNMPTVSFKLP